MTSIPEYWKTTLADVEATAALCKRGKVRHIADSAGGRKIYSFEYGCSNLKRGLSDNCSTALGAGDIRAYADKTGEDYIPTVFLVGCVHGGEFEGTSALLNLIKLIETETDYKNERDDTLRELAMKAHLIIIPIANPDGRSHIPFNTFVGRTFKELRYYNQGTWKDGTLCGWPECKKVHPIKDYVDHLGGYFNDDGINMMHEDFFGKVSNETRAILEICKAEAPDFSVLFHGGSNTVSCILEPEYAPWKCKLEYEAVESCAKEACDSEGIRFGKMGIRELEKRENPPAFNLPSAMCHCCAEPAVTFESNQGLTDHGNVIYGHDEIYRVHSVFIRELLRYELQKYGRL